MKHSLYMYPLTDQLWTRILKIFLLLIYVKCCPSFNHSEFMNCFNSHFYPGMRLFASVLLMAMPGFSSLPTFPKNLFSLCPIKAHQGKCSHQSQSETEKNVSSESWEFQWGLKLILSLFSLWKEHYWLWYLYVSIVSSIRKIFLKCCSRQSVILRPHISYLTPQSLWDINQRRVMIVQDSN